MYQDTPISYERRSPRLGASCCGKTPVEAIYMNQFSRGMRLAAAVGLTTAIAVMPAMRAYAASSPAPVPVVEVTPIAGGDTTAPAAASDPSTAMDDTAAGIAGASNDLGAAVSNLGGGT